MKVLTLVGAPVGVANRYKESRPLARVYFKKHGLFGWGKQELVVEPLGETTQQFTQEVYRLLVDRLENHPKDAFVCAAPTKKQPHTRKFVAANDPDVLEAMRCDSYLWGGLPKPIANYYVLQMHSKVEEVKKL